MHYVNKLKPKQDMKWDPHIFAVNFAQDGQTDF